MLPGWCNHNGNLTIGTHLFATDIGSFRVKLVTMVAFSVYFRCKLTQLLSILPIYIKYIYLQLFNSSFILHGVRLLSYWQLSSPIQFTYFHAVFPFFSSFFSFRAHMLFTNNTSIDVLYSINSFSSSYKAMQSKSIDFLY